MFVRYLLIWIILAFVATVNGIIRQTTYGKVVSELSAHQISTASAIRATGVVVWIANKFWAIESEGQAWAIGLLWLLFTILFEFGFGHYVVGHPWQVLLADYNIANGRIWALFLVWILILPFFTFSFAKKVM